MKKLATLATLLLVSGGLMAAPGEPAPQHQHKPAAVKKAPAKKAHKAPKRQVRKAAPKKAVKKAPAKRAHKVAPKRHH
ncbi:hypothetical protein [Neisseria perflava]|uniref:hypothetical protein n=1 Tax=Neisseria perflava TaxID=33053 RepID=UPI00209F681B|nr:hypothetical protein [Neisseria perflava]MCP1659388.1 hypothetical protein [Neisseria perflava]